jgi:hypothetical protein
LCAIATGGYPVRETGDQNPLQSGSYFDKIGKSALNKADNY